MTGAALLIHQFRYDQRMFWRNVPSVFFSLALPLIFLFIFATVFGDSRYERLGVTLDNYYVPGIISLGIVSATLLNVAISVTVQREQGILKRLRGTPLPTRVFVAGRAGSAIVNAYLIAAVIALAGFLVYGVDISLGRLLGAAIVCGVAAASFCCLGFALSAVIPNQDAAPAVTNAIVLPLYFISGVFFPVDNAPEWLTKVAELFPVRHLTVAMLDVYSPQATGLGFAWKDLAVIAAWGVLGLILAMRYFRWAPRH